ncbi:hypothetical protein D1BOALGB6SA_6098 [Olavius sp. associated proteobacterium Delta 1]|nr:hypothetical protein D1BOALGB6SA_6098 [Olavius sp. associated proteobacterium Delta 1]
MTLKRYPLLQQMIDDMGQQSSLYKPTQFWQICSARLIEDLNKSRIEKFRSLPSSLSFFVPTYSYPNYYMDPKRFEPVKNTLWPLIEQNKLFMMRFENLIAGKIHAFADYRTFLASSTDSSPYTDLISESNVGEPIEQFLFDGRKFSRSFLNYLLGINFIKKNTPTDKIKTVMEIGGGFGTLGEILLGDKRNECFYINADIPPLAYVSDYYLKILFGDENICGYGELKGDESLDIDDLKERYKALSLCSWQVPKLQGKIDLFVNFISFQEMEPDIVENYCENIRRLKPEFILLRNLKEGKKKKDKKNPIGVTDPILGRDYNNYFPEYELMDANTTVFGYETEDGFHSELRLYKLSD